MPTKPKPRNPNRPLKRHKPKPDGGGLAAVTAAVAGAALGSVVKTSIAKAVDNVAADASVPGLDMADAPEVMGAVMDVLGKDPQFVNATNSESPLQSRIGIGGGVGVVGALGILVPLAAKWFGVDIEPTKVVEVVFAVMALAGPAYSLYGRFVKGLKPLFSKGATV